MDELNIGCSAIETIWILRIAGVFLGFLLGCFYIHYAWYTRGPDTDVPRKNVKIKGLGIFSLTTGVPALLGLKFSSMLPLTYYMLLSGLAFSVFILFIMVLVAYKMGYNSALDPLEKRRVATNCASEAFFKGWPFANEIMLQQITSIHQTSKRAILKLVRDTSDLLENPAHTKPNREEFIAGFKSILSMILYQFFQHDRNRHPDFCASYYDLDHTKKEFGLIARVSGGGNYHKDHHSVLGKDSVAMKAAKSGILILYPDQKKDFNIRALKPKLKNRKIKRFLVIPVPVDENLDLCHRKGVICIDTAKKNAWQLTDDFHVDLLEWSSTIIKKLHDEYLA